MKKPENAAFFILIVFILLFTDFRQPIWMILLVSLTVALSASLISSANQESESIHHEDY